MEEALFQSVEAALRFAYNYSEQQSPPTPMSRLTPNSGSGKGLCGLDGAAQAGLILRELDNLPDDQRRVLTVRFGDVRKVCQCCGQDAPTDEWNNAIAALGWMPELEGYPHMLRKAMLEKVICRRNVELKQMIHKFQLIDSTTYRHLAIIRKKLHKVEQNGMAELEQRFKAAGLLFYEK